MHITLDTKAFGETLELVARVSTKHVTLPVLECVLLDAVAGALILRATNLETGIEVRINADPKEHGTIAVPAQTLLQTVNLHSGRDIEIFSEEGTLVVKGGGSVTKIKSIPHEEFPNLPSLGGDGQRIVGGLFSLGMRSAAFAASQSSIKPELGSVYVYQKREQTLTFVATDSFRLMEKTVPQKGVTMEQSLLVPYKNALELSRVIDHIGSDPMLRYDENQCSLTFDEGVTITSRLVAGSFPDYNQIIPKEYVTETTVLRDDLIHAFKRSGVFLNKFFQVRLSVERDSLTVSADNGEVGTTTESMKAKTDGEDIVLNFNQRYVFDALAHFVDDSVTLKFAGIGRPMVIVGVGDTSVRYLVMPMNK